MRKLRKDKREALIRFILCVSIGMCLFLLAALFVVFFVYGFSYMERIDIYKNLSASEVTLDGVRNMIQVIEYTDTIIRSLVKIITLLTLLNLIGLLSIVGLRGRHKDMARHKDIGNRWG